MNRRQLVLGLLLLPSLPIARAFGRLDEPIVGLPCEGCEAVFDGRPHDPPSHARIAAVDEPGEPLRLYGTVHDRAGHPQAGIIVYAYHTDQSGHYPSPLAHVGNAAMRHGRLRAWAQTDANGRYQFDTIRPGSYPARDLPEHIHMHVIEPDRATYYIDDVMFRDDPKLTPKQIRLLTLGRGGSGITSPVRKDGTWLVRRDIVLGLHIPGYPTK
jgi:protocatechuate 3,4-dioxygenase beta subunit